MWTYEDAKRIVEEFLNKKQTLANSRIAVNDRVTIVKPYGWILFYECEEFVRSQSPIDACLVGNFPILVDRERETFIYLMSPWEKSVERYEHDVGFRDSSNREADTKN